MVRKLPSQRQDRPLTTTFAVAKILKKAIAPDFENRKIRGFSFKKPVCSTFGRAAMLKGGEAM